MRSLDTNNLVNWLNPLNQGLRSWHIALPQRQWGGGTVLHDVTRRADGAFVNMDNTSWRGTDRPGGYGALDMNGTDERIDCGTAQHIPNSNDYTVVSTFKTASTGSYCIASQRDSFAVGDDLFFVGNDVVVGAVATRDATAFFDNVGRVAFSTGKFIQAAWVGSSAPMRFFEDGQLLSIDTQVSDSATAATGGAGITLRIGATDTTPAAHFPGLIDDIRIYNRALSDQEVKALYEESRMGHPNTLNFMRRPLKIPAAAPAGNAAIFYQHYKRLMAG